MQTDKLNTLNKSICLKRAKPEDCQFVYESRNAAHVCQHSLNQAFIPLLEHLKWYDNTIANPLETIFIIVKETIQCGVLRFSSSPEHCQEAVISIYINANYTKQGIATIAIYQGLQWLQTYEQSVSQCHAFVQKHNKASIHLFEKAGFICQTKESSVETEQSCIYHYLKSIDIFPNPKASYASDSS